MTDEDRILLRQIAEGQAEMLSILRHGLAGPPGDHGPRKGWLRELIAVAQRGAHPVVSGLHPGAIHYAPIEEGILQSGPIYRQET